MTYGENVGQIRESMATLLGWHRIQQRLGGGGCHTIPVTTTVTERERMGQIIARYRLAALTWCHQAVTAATPKTDLSQKASSARNPVEDLRYQLGEAVAAVAEREPLLDLFATRHRNPLLDTWQSLARAAALGEHDFGAGVDFGSLTPGQANTVVTDAADLSRGLVLLDRRYSNVPGWTHLKQPDRLDIAAEATAILAREAGQDTAVDGRGWRRPAGRIDGSALPGIAGAVQAQHNLLVELGRFPHAVNLRRVLHSQAQASHEAAKQAAVAAPDLAERFAERALLYRDLVRASRDLGGLVGGGAQVVIESQHAASRLQRSTVTASNVAESLHELSRLFPRTDARITATIEHGFNDKLYFVAVNYPRLMDDQAHGIHSARKRWMPVTSPVQTDLLPFVRDRLRPVAPHPTVAPDAVESRRAYEALLAQQPGIRSSAIQER